MMTQIALFIRHKARPGQRAALLELWQRHVQDYVSASPGHLVYAYCEATDDPDVIEVFQLHADATCAQTFADRPWYAAYHQGTEALLAEPSQFRQAQPVWVKAGG